MHSFDFFFLMSEKKKKTPMHSFDYLFLFEMSEKLSQVRK